MAKGNGFPPGAIVRARSGNDYVVEDDCALRAIPKGATPPGLPGLVTWLDRLYPKSLARELNRKPRKPSIAEEIRRAKNGPEASALLVEASYLCAAPSASTRRRWQKGAQAVVTRIDRAA